MGLLGSRDPCCRDRELTTPEAALCMGGEWEWGSAEREESMVSERTQSSRQGDS